MQSEMVVYPAKSGQGEILPNCCEAQFKVAVLEIRLEYRVGALS
jgi:hypothetical protein